MVIFSMNILFLPAILFWLIKKSCLGTFSLHQLNHDLLIYVCSHQLKIFFLLQVASMSLLILKSAHKRVQCLRLRQWDQCMGQLGCLSSSPLPLISWADLLVQQNFFSITNCLPCYHSWRQWWCSEPLLSSEVPMSIIKFQVARRWKIWPNPIEDPQ